MGSFEKLGDGMFFSLSVAKTSMVFHVQFGSVEHYSLVEQSPTAGLLLRKTMAVVLLVCPQCPLQIRPHYVGNEVS